jgi:hypothetical protein
LWLGNIESVENSRAFGSLGSRKVFAYQTPKQILEDIETSVGTTMRAATNKAAA